MAAPRKYSVELQQRATRMAIEARKDPESARGAIKRVADQLGVHPEALRNWVRQAVVPPRSWRLAATRRPGWASRWSARS
ncbi:transposase [Serinicoccus marinus]|uniref:transposase n=1 Tax=Serinicoccus marinus TaxID=247333 RepID=UPI00122E9B02